MWRTEDKPNFVGLTERHELQRQGIKVAKADGKHLGRPRVEYPENWEDCFYRLVKKYEAEFKNTQEEMA